MHILSHLFPFMYILYMTKATDNLNVLVIISFSSNSLLIPRVLARSPLKCLTFSEEHYLKDEAQGAALSIMLSRSQQRRLAQWMLEVNAALLLHSGMLEHRFYLQDAFW